MSKSRGLNGDTRSNKDIVEPHLHYGRGVTGCDKRPNAKRGSQCGIGSHTELVPPAHWETRQDQAATQYVVPRNVGEREPTQYKNCDVDDVNDRTAASSTIRQRKRRE